MHYSTLSLGKRIFVVLLALVGIGQSAIAQDHSVAREWNEVLLEAIRDDYARPTVHARNLYHTSLVMYDAWAAYDSEAKPFFLGENTEGFIVPFDGVVIPETDEEIQAAQEEAVTYAAYRLLSHRFTNSPGANLSQARFNNLMNELEYDMNFTSTDYVNGPPAALGNYIAEQMIEFGLDDGSNEEGNYENEYYLTINPWLVMDEYGNPNMNDPNRWQQLNIATFIDQAGNELTVIPDFLSPEWGNVVPFALTDFEKTFHYRDGEQYIVYHDPGSPALLDTLSASDFESYYKWGHSLVAAWSSHLDPTDGVMIDISPISIGNIQSYPDTYAEYPDFYDWENGGDASVGWGPTNPVTGEAYEPQMVPRGDYGRVLAEFWADGPDSETPPGHWFTILNYVSDHPDLVKKWNGQGEVLSNLEWDVRSYLVMGGAMHDCAIVAWGIKGWYDYVRPVSAIRFMAEQGQSTDPDGASYHPQGIPLVPGFIELVEAGDPLAGDNDEFVGDIKLRAWKGPNYIENPAIDQAGVDWILAGNWWPYQRPTFVTPPFAGYISGHSTYSRGAAEVMTLMTGSEFFPGGMGIFDAPQNQFLVFEEGPSMDIELQWASYRDASDQCSLSRIWGGIHPPCDDIPGRKLGMIIGPEAYDYAMVNMEAANPRIEMLTTSVDVVTDADAGSTFTVTAVYDKPMDMLSTPGISFPSDDVSGTLTLASTDWINDSTAVFTFDVIDGEETILGIKTKIMSAEDMDGNKQIVHLEGELFGIDNENPMTDMTVANTDLLTDAQVGAGSYALSITFNESMDTSVNPEFTFPDEDASASLSINDAMSGWDDDMNYTVVFDLADANEDIEDIDFLVTTATDAVGNVLVEYTEVDGLDVDTKNPSLFLLAANTYNVDLTNVGSATFSLIAIFDEEMDQDLTPDFSFPVEDPLANTLTWNEGESSWINPTTYIAKYDVTNSEEVLADIDVTIAGLTDWVGNAQLAMEVADHFNISMVIVGVEETDGIGLVSVYPNPVPGGEVFTVEVENMPSTMNLMIYTTLGQVVRSEQVNASGNRLELSTAGMASGNYFVHLYSSEGQAVFQLEVAK
ncbi:MAG: T9SS type A sorting domain-containing protein [Flavobacteriales bacterium]|nr:T9SS type A sorting domain-containing protein [Flavobacteriales bacterium]